MAFTDDKIIVFDTTLRDGEQSPGGSMNINEKLAIATQLQQLGVDVVEAGFPVISRGDFNAVELIAQKIRGPIICALARAVDRDIEVAAQALKAADKKRIHVFIATSEIHMKYKLKLTPTQVLLKAVSAVKKAKRYVNDVEFSAEDAARSDLGFLVRVIEAVIDAGATTVNIPDTVGYSTPAEFGHLIKTIRTQVSNISKATLSVHCHNDLGLATANSLAAIESGARQVECTINGIGERSGNCALEELTMALKTRQNHFKVTSQIKTQQLLKSSRLVESITGILVQPNKAVVGRNSFAHEAGIHQHGVIQNRETYEIMRAEDVGFSGNQIVLGKHSGKHALKQWLLTNQFIFSEKQVAVLFEAMKALCDKQKRLDDFDLFQLVSQTGFATQLPQESTSFLRTKRW
ncbi:2-isopropylmalate synthase [Aliikangiella sp. IMCC44653]